MKKLLALLLSCAMITVACASCDKDEKKEKEHVKLKHTHLQNSIVLFNVDKFITW